MTTRGCPYRCCFCTTSRMFALYRVRSPENVNESFYKKELEKENAFAFTGNVKKDILSITSAHSMRKASIEEYLKKANTNWSQIEILIRENKLVEVEYNNKKFYIRKLYNNRE